MLQKLKIWSVILFFLVLSINSLEARGRAFLGSGPFLSEAMPGIGANSIQGFRGVYMLPAESPESAQTSITVYFAQTAISVFDTWRTVASSPFTIYATESETVYVYVHARNWSFFIDFQKVENINLYFAEDVIRQMIFFAGDGSNFINSSFPAFVEF
ncbi:MAG: hypothetical protein FWD87_00185 [Spirochaetaceae bacterium]|nr:hypothetical protein [Spirochaetaceae bacterium]